MQVLIGEIVKGDQRGRTLGFPTANLKLSTEIDTTKLEDGVYAGIALIIDPATGEIIRFPGKQKLNTSLLGPLGQLENVYTISQIEEFGLATATHVGSKSTFNLTKQEYEAHILDFDAEIYGKILVNFLLTKLRGTEKFTSIEALIEQMKKDVYAARKLTIQE